MAVNPTRPKNLDLFTIKFPITAITSITHRISGIVLFFSVPVWLWLLSSSLASATAFQEMQGCIDSTLGKLFLFASLSALAYHFVFGIKHLMMDLGWGESLEGGRIMAQLGLLIAALLIAAIGVWVW